MTRISADHKRNLGQIQQNGHRNVSSTSNNKQEHIGSYTKEYGTRPRVV